MAVTTLAAIRAGLAANLTATFTNTQVYEYVLSEPSPPCFEIDTMSAGGVTYDGAMHRGIDEYEVTVRGIVGLTGDQTAQVTSDAWLDSSGGNSVKAALESDKTLGGAVQTLRVEGAIIKAMASPAVPNSQYLAAEWRVHIWATGQ